MLYLIILQNKTWKNIIQIDHPYTILIVEGSGFGKSNALLNLINHEPDIDKTCSYAKESYEANIDR